MKKGLFFAGLALIVAIGCKKDDDNNNTPGTPTKDRIVGVWTGETASQKVVLPGLGTLVDTSFSITDVSFDFRADNLLIVTEGGIPDTASWTVVNSTTISIDGFFLDTVANYQIKTLNANNFDLYLNEAIEVFPGVNANAEVTVKMNR
jgi:hypothetical protein